MRARRQVQSKLFIVNINGGMGKGTCGRAPGDTRVGIRGGKLPGTVGRHRQVRMELKVLYMHFILNMKCLDCAVKQIDRRRCLEVCVKI
jgi:hypothetical protein